MTLIKSADEILSKDDFSYTIIDVPEWGGSLRIRSLSGAERTIITKMINQRKDGDGLFEKLVMLASIDEDGKPLFWDDKQKDVYLKALQGKSAAVTQRIGKEILKLSGFTEDAVPDVESAEKN